MHFDTMRELLATTEAKVLLAVDEYNELYQPSHWHYGENKASRGMSMGGGGRGGGGITGVQPGAAQDSAPMGRTASRAAHAHDVHWSKERIGDVLL